MATIDRRDGILARCFAVLQTIPGIPPANVVHNRGELPPGLRPGITMLDADELSDERAFERQRLITPTLMRLTPIIYITLDTRKPGNDTVGSDLNGYRVQILKAVMLDQQLQSLVQEIRYMGCSTDLKRGEQMNGEMALVITFIYPLIPSEL